jgi:hypothetical protein
MTHGEVASGFVDFRAAVPLRVPNWSSTSGDPGVFVYQPVEPIATSDAKVG